METDTCVATCVPAVAARVRGVLRAAAVTDAYRIALATTLALPGHILAERAQARWAPLVCACCVAAGGRLEDAVPAATAAELFMVALDVLDDAEDDEDTVLKVSLGPARALNVSTGLLLLAQQGLLAAPGGTALMSILLDAGVRACAGQHADLAPVSEHGYDLDGALEAAAGKSASLVAALCRLGATCAGADAGTQDLYARFGASVGMVMQLRNDIAAVRPDMIGKTDKALGRPTLPLAAAAGAGMMTVVDGSGEDVHTTSWVGEPVLLTWTVAETYRLDAVELIPSLSGDPDGRAALTRLVEGRHEA